MDALKIPFTKESYLALSEFKTDRLGPKTKCSDGIFRIHISTAVTIYDSAVGIHFQNILRILDRSVLFIYYTWWDVCMCDLYLVVYRVIKQTVSMYRVRFTVLVVSI